MTSTGVEERFENYHRRCTEHHVLSILFVYIFGFRNDLRPYSPTPVNVNCRLKYFVTLVTYCYNNVFVYFNLQLTLTGVGEYGPVSFIKIKYIPVIRIIL
jgi:hypothetical protein